MKTIYQAKAFINENIGKNVVIKVNGLRNKIECYNGVITECYDNIFIVNTKMGKKSFTYTDVLVGNVSVDVKKS